MRRASGTVNASGKPWQPTPIVLMTTVIVLCLAGPAMARINAVDRIATHRYLEARVGLNRATRNDEPAQLDAFSALERQVKAECPGVLAGAPPHTIGEKRTESEQEITTELLVATFGVAEHAEHTADAQFAKTVRRLRWSDRKLTRLLRSLARERAAQSAIPTPDLCSDMRFWVASSYSKVSEGTTRYLHRVQVVSSLTQIESEPNEPVSNFLNPDALVAHRLRPYEDAAARKLAKKAFPHEPKRIPPRVTRLLEAEGRVLEALGDSSPAPSQGSG